MAGQLRRGPFIVVGMGRSGTSYVGSIFEQAGVSMGSEVKPPDEHNPRGYFEDLEPTRMHVRWLDRRGLSIASISDALPLQATADEAAEIDRYLAAREAEGLPWGLKAPGILPFWPAWWERLPETSIVLLPFRHPSAVAESFERYGLGREISLPLWLQTNRLALAALDAGPFEGVVLDFDDRAGFVSALRPVLGTYVDPYEPQLVHHGPQSDSLGPELLRLYEELLARTSV